jgi:hypothetical protein
VSAEQQPQDPSEYNPNSASSSMRWAREADDQEAVEAFKRRMFTGRAERALRRALADAPPLTAQQVAHLRSVLADYDPAEVEGQVQ